VADPQVVPGNGSGELSESTLARIRHMGSLYPSSRSAVLPALWAIQDDLGYLPSWSLEVLATELGLLPADVEAVSSFYSMYFNHQPGRHQIQVCRNVSCGLRGADDLLRHLEQWLGVEDGGSTADGVFTLEGTVECLGACGGAPMMQVDRFSYENLTLERAEEVLSRIRDGRQGGAG